MLAAIESAGYRFRGVHEVGGADTRDLLPAVAQNMGVAFVASSLVEVGNGGVARRLLDPAPSTPETVVAWHANPPRWPPAVLDTVRSAARMLASEDLAQTIVTGRSADDAR
jgi:DNA-binding transcriptional LysR family regulator